MTELFRGLDEMDSPLSEEDKVVYLLASLPESFSVLVTALEAFPEVPKMDVVTERMLHEERKSNARGDAVDEKALTMKMKANKLTPRRKACAIIVAGWVTTNEIVGSFTLKKKD